MEALEELRSLVMRHAGTRPSGLSRLTPQRHDKPTEIAGELYEPTAFIVLQGTKRTIIGDKVFEYGPGQTVIVSAEIAAMDQVTEASAEKPFHRWTTTGPGGDHQRGALHVRSARVADSAGF